MKVAALEKGFQHGVIRLIGALLFTALLPLFSADGTDSPLNERATAAAWVAFNGDKFEAAIQRADECIDEFRGAAKRTQEKLEQEKADLPTGAVSDQQKKKIFENGLLNAVGTCYFIKGRAAEKLGRKEDAKKAYVEAKKLSYARTWDPQGWFWSPAESASDRLMAMQ